MRRSTKLILITAVSTVLSVSFLAAGGFVYLSTRPKYTPEGIQWGMSLCAIIFELEHYNHKTLSGFDKATIIPVMRLRPELQSTWGIRNEKDLRKSLCYMSSGGHTRTFYLLKRIVETERNLTDEQIAAKYELPSDHYLRLCALRNNYDLYREINFVAWDWGRYVSLCRWGYAAGYLEEKEAIDYLMNIAVLIQAQYSSWEEYGYDYVVGRTLYGAGIGRGDEFFADSIIACRALTSAGGLWETQEWRTQLYSDEYLLLERIRFAVRDAVGSVVNLFSKKNASVVI